MTAGLHIAPELTLPVDAITETFALLAVRRAGKSNAAVVMAEEMYDNGLPWVAIDPKGDWWGIRAAGDGKAPGLSVLVFGGLHGDVPLEPTAGKLVADLVVDQRITCVLDVSEMSKADMGRFLTAFALRLYQRNSEPLHVFCEEADEYIPQMVRGEAAALVGAFEKLIKRGGFKGIGVTLITQRSASLNKDVLTQVGTLIPMRTPSPQDRKAIEAWVNVHDAGQDAVNELPGLESGEAWVFSPQWLRTLVKIKFRRRRTFDSGATPKVGGKPRPPANLADVDVAAIKDAMAETIEKQAASDPARLQKRVRELERQLAKAPTVPERVVETVEVSVLKDEDRAQLEKWLEQTEFMAKQVQTLLDRKGAVPRHPVAAKAPARPPTPTRPVAAVSTTTRTEPVGDVSLSKAERKIVAVLSQYGPRTMTQVALQSGYSSKGGGFRNALSSLRTAGLVVGGKDNLQLTDAGETVAADIPPLPTGPELIEHWRNQFGKAERLIFDQLLTVWPDTIDQDMLAELTDYSPAGGGFRNALSKLRTLQVIEGGRDAMKVADEIGGSQ